MRPILPIAISVALCLLCSTSVEAQKPEGYYLNAVNLLNAGEPDQAYGELNKALALDSTHAQSRILRAFMLLQAGDKKGALADYSMALRSAPDDLGALTNRALIYMEMEKYEEAEKDLKRRLKNDPFNWMASYDLAYCYGLMGDYDRAIEGFDIAIERNPKFPESYMNRAFARYQKYSLMGMATPPEEVMLEVCEDFYRAESLDHEPAKEAIAKYCGD